MMAIDWTPLPGRVTADGRTVELDEEAAYDRQVQALAGQEIELVIRQRRKNRSVQANALYWAAYVAPLAEWTGYDPYEMHCLLKKLFLPAVDAKHLVVCDMHGQIVVEDDVPIDLTTTRLDTTEFSTYLDAITRWAAEKLEIEIPGERRRAAS